MFFSVMRVRQRQCVCLSSGHACPHLRVLVYCGFMDNIGTTQLSDNLYYIIIIITVYIDNIGVYPQLSRTYLSCIVHYRHLFGVR